MQHACSAYREDRLWIDTVACVVTDHTRFSFSF